MSHRQTITVTLSECCNRSTIIIDGIAVCDKCESETDTYETTEKYYDEIGADDSRGMADEQIETAVNKLS